MKGSILRWTTAIAATAVLAVPAATFAQTPPATTPQPPAASATADTQAASPADHIRLAKAAIESIPADSLTAKPKAQVAALKRHLSSLERAAAAKDAKAGAAATAATAGAAKAGASWATEVAAIDKIVTELTGNASTPGAAAPTGTAGAAAVALDPTTSAKLAEVRTHVTAFAAAMSGTAPAANTAAPMTSSPDAMAAANPPATSSAAPTATASAQPPATGSQPPAPQPATPSTPDPAVAGTTPQPTPDATVDQEAAAKHLTAARDALTQLTQLPAAAQLTGDARTQVQGLIANFNELITTKAEWRASYAKVDANLTALLGVERADESPATPPAATPPAATPATPPTSPPTGTAGAVGTGGTTTVNLDPALRAKLMEMRTHLVAFQKAAGGPGL
jgi:hypothetical protein